MNYSVKHGLFRSQVKIVPNFGQVHVLRGQYVLKHFRLAKTQRYSRKSETKIFNSNIYEISSLLVLLLSSKDYVIVLFQRIRKTISIACTFYSLFSCTHFFFYINSSLSLSIMKINKYSLYFIFFAQLDSKKKYNERNAFNIPKVQMFNTNGQQKQPHNTTNMHIKTRIKTLPSRCASACVWVCVRLYVRVCLHN